MVFFDDILVFLVRENQLYAKMSNCRFGCPEVDYLGHIISNKEVKADPKKIQATVDWPFPETIKSLCGFLGLTRYYSNLFLFLFFIKEYGAIATPLILMLTKNSFSWGEPTIEAFKYLKTTITSSSILALPNFSQPSRSIGAVLMQQKQPIAFLSKDLKGNLSICQPMRKSYLAL